jgi:hypothetical protein
LSAAAIFVASSAARAAPRRETIELTYVRGPGAAVCPDAQAFRKAVSRQMDYDPFEPGAGLRLKASVTREAGVLVGSMELRDEANLVIWEKRIHEQNDCAMLLRGMAVSLAIHFEPEPEPPAPACPACPPARRRRLARRRRRRRRPCRRLRFRPRRAGLSSWSEAARCSASRCLRLLPRGSRSSAGCAGRTRRSTSKAASYLQAAAGK